MKTLLLILTITLGIVFPFMEKYSFLIKYLLMLMLFFSFLTMNIKRSSFHTSHITILIINIFTPLILFYLINIYNPELAKVVFITSIAPTAIASPIIIKLLNGKIEYAVISIILTNISVAILLPILIPVMINDKSILSFTDVLVPIMTVFLFPFLLAEIIKRLFPLILSKLIGINKYIFYILVLNINLGTSKASFYIRQEMSFYDPIIYETAAASLVLCVLNFLVGSLISPSNYKIEGAQSLGQKNNGFTVWVSLAFISPLAVLGPVFYILFQNLYISWQLHKNKV